MGPNQLRSVAADDHLAPIAVVPRAELQLPPDAKLGAFTIVLLCPFQDQVQAALGGRREQDILWGIDPRWLT